MPGELDRVQEQANNRMAASPFDSPEVAARWHSVTPWNTASPSPRPKVPAVASIMSPGWNLAPQGVIANGRAVSAGHVQPPVNGSARLLETEDSNSAQSHWDRYTQIASVDQSRHELFQDILARNNQLEQRLLKVESDYEREVDYNRGSQTRDKARNDEIKQLKAYMTQYPFILVLIDGNNLSFRSSLIAKAENGGYEAAALLNDAVFKWTRDTLRVTDPDLKVVIRIYADVRRLAEAHCNSGILQRASAMDDFVRGFCKYRNLFDVIHTSYSHSMLGKRLQDQINLHLYDPRCRQIFLGGVQDLSLLQQLESDEHALNRVALLGASANTAIPECSLETIALSKVFRDTLDSQAAGGASINVFSPELTGLPTPPPSMAAISRQLSEVSVKDVKDFTPASRPMAKSLSTESAMSSAKASPATIAARPAVTQPVSNSWASLAAKPAPVQTIASTPSYKAAEPVVPTIPRNKRGQRIDPPVKHDQTEVLRVKAFKMCNVHYLRGPCRYGDGCSHSHKHKPTTVDLKTLRHVARMAPCENGSDCDDLACIYGHICPAPDGRNGEACIFGTNCRFPENLHKIDRTAVKTIKV